MSTLNHSSMQELAATAAVAVVVFGTLAVAAAMATRRKRWSSDKERTQRENIRHTIATTLVGPKPQWVPVVPTVASDVAKSKSPEIRMLTTFHQSSNSPSRAAIHRPITAVIIHGFGCTSLEWGRFIKLLQSQTSLDIFAYDRILFVKDEYQGLLTRQRDAATLAQELHALLHNRQEKELEPKYLLIGHSYGGLIAQHFAGLYADQVLGMVLIDPAHEEQFQRFPRDFTFSFTTVVPVILNLYQRLAWTGVLVWLDRLSLFSFPPLFLLQPPDNPVRRACAQLYSQDGSIWKLVAAELQGCNETFDRINRDGGKFRREQSDTVTKIPTSLVVAGKRRYSPTLFPRKVTQAFLEMHTTCLSHAKVFIAHDSDHWVHMSEPEVVLEAVHYVVNELSRNS